MEIDLEIPSHEQYLETELDDNIDEINNVDGMGVHDEDAVNKACGTNASASVSGCVEQFDTGFVRVDDNDKESIWEPKVGLLFESKESAYYFYREYAQKIGFGITIKASRRSKKSAKFIDVKIACSRFGSKRDTSTTVNPRSCPKSGCKAGLHLKRLENEKWIIFNFVEEHNHDINPGDFQNSIRGNREYQSKKEGLELALDGGDVDAMLEHFMRMQEENRGFFYALDLDNGNRVKNVFWIDAKAKHEYCSFSDVVFFDTFYLRENYKTPYVPFIGVNRHYQYVLLGSALIGEESASTFDWLMQTWLKSVSGEAPQVILTDQDKILSEVVKQIFPGTRHYFCLWHVISKVRENINLSGIELERFIKNFDKSIHGSWTDEEFTRSWCKLLDKYELTANQCVLSLYEDRKNWVPTFMHGTSLAGLSTSDRSRSIASYFDKYINSEDAFRSFIEKYRMFSDDNYKLEVSSGLETRNKQEVRSLSSFERQLSPVYTDTVFEKFQAEVSGVVSCHLQKETEDEETIVYRVDDFVQNQNFLVSWNEKKLDVRCLCRSFEYKGFLCKHALLVLQKTGVTTIPSCYILSRWSKEADLKKSNFERPNKLQFRVQRFNDLCKRAIRLGEVGSLSQESYTIALQALEEASKHLENSDNTFKFASEPNGSAAHDNYDIQEENLESSIGKPSEKKNRKRKVNPEPDGVTNMSQDSYQHMEQVNSRAHMLDTCYIPHQDVDRMHVGSRAPNLEAFKGSEQNVRGLQGQMSLRMPPAMQASFDIVEDMTTDTIECQIIASRHQSDKHY